MFYLVTLPFKAVLLACLFALLSNSAMASEQHCAQQDCITANSWQLGLAIGVGARSNPLVGGDDIPLILLPDIAWYGEAFYFDNGELGYQWAPSPTTSIEWFIAPNTEKANFSFWHTANILIPAASLGANVPDGSSQPDGDQPDEYELNIDDIESRRWAVDSGARVQWYKNNHQLRITAKTDVSGVHSGHQMGLEYRYRISFDNWRFGFNTSATWQSAELVDYYYGIASQDTDNENLFYTGRAGINYSIGLSANYRLTEQWQMLLRTEITQLHSGMTDSPIINETNIATSFVGLAYRF